MNIYWRLLVRRADTCGVTDEYRYGEKRKDHLKRKNVCRTPIIITGRVCRFENNIADNRARFFWPSGEGGGNNTKRNGW